MNVKFAQGDKITYTHPVTGEVKGGTVLKSQPLKDWQGKVLVKEVLSITWDDGTVDHAWHTEGVKRVDDAPSTDREES